MIRAIKTNDGKLGSVSGNTVEVMMFFHFWQFKMWPKWIADAKLGTETDVMHRQVSAVVRDLKEGHSLKLWDQGKECEASFEFAIEKCKALGIEIIETPAAA